MWKTYIESNTTFGEIVGLSKPQEWSYIAFQILLFLVGVVGNSLVLYASLKYKAVSLDRIIVILIENIAVADLVIVIIVFGVISVNLVYGRWAFGDHMCFILGYTKHAFFVAEFCLIVLIGICKLHALHKPLSSVLTTKIVKSAVSLIWIISTLYVGSWPLTAIGMFYDPLTNSCMPFLNPSANYVFVAFHFLVIAVIFLTNLMILFVAKKHSRSHKSIRKATLTVSTVCWVFIGSYGPWLWYWGLAGAGKSVPNILVIVGVISMQINLVANPFIYSFTNRRFYNFLKGLIRHEPPVTRRGVRPTNTPSTGTTTTAKEMSTT